jgi:hypothetical protein
VYRAASGAISFCTAKLLPTAVVEQGLLKLAHLVSSLDVIGLISSGGRASDSAGEASKLRAAWVESLHDTQWLSGVQMLLQTTLDIVELIRNGDPVLVRSADIGDAVPQVTSLVQVLSNRSTDPWARTSKFSHISSHVAARSCAWTRTTARLPAFACWSRRSGWRVVRLQQRPFLVVLVLVHFLT